MVEGFMNTDKIGEVVGSFGSLEIMDSLLAGGKAYDSPQPRNGIMDLPPYLAVKSLCPDIKKYLNSRRMKTHLARVPMR